MAKKVDHISLKKSTVAGKIPSSDVLVDGELAVNIAEGGEKIFLRNTKPEIVEFSSDKLLDKKYLSTTSGGTVNGETTFNKDVKIVYPDSGSTPVSLREVMVNNEMAVAAALNDLDTRITEQKTDIDSIKTKEYLPLSGGTVNGNLTVTGNTEFNGDVKIVYPDSSSQTVSLREVMVENEKVTAAALNDLNERNDELSAKVTEQKTDIDNLSQKYLPLSGGTMSGDIRYDEQDAPSLGNMSGATYSLSGITIKNKSRGRKINVSIINSNSINIAQKDAGQIGAETATTISYESVTSPKFVKTGATADDILLGDGTTKKVFDFLQENGDGVVSITEILTDKIDGNDGLYIGTVTGIESADYDKTQGGPIDIWTTDGKTKPIGNFLQTSGGTVTGDTTFTKDVKVVFPNSETPTSLVGAIVSNEKVTSAALNNLNEKVNDHKSDIDNLKAQKNLPLSGGTVTGEATFSGGLKFRYPDVSSTPVSLRDVIADNEEVTAAALNDLNDKINKIGDISIANGVLIINDGNTKYKLNLEQLVTGGYATKE